MDHHEDFTEDPMMRELHQIREEFARQQEESGLSVLEWLEATEKDMRKSLAEVGFRMIKRNDRLFLYEINSHSKKQKKPSTSTSLSRTPPTAKRKNYDDMSEASRAQELQCVREDRSSSDKIEPPSQKKSVKYKTTAKRRAKNLRKKQSL
jgi:hypothetical protein